MDINEINMILNNYEYNKIHIKNYLKRNKKDTIINYNPWEEIRKALRKKEKIKEAKEKYGKNLNDNYFKERYFE